MWFIYVERKTQPGTYQYYAETTLGEVAAQEDAARLAAKGSRAFIVNQYLGGTTKLPV